MIVRSGVIDSVFVRNCYNCVDHLDFFGLDLGLTSCLITEAPYIDFEAMSSGSDWTKIFKRRANSGLSSLTRWENSSPEAASFVASWKVWDWSSS